jgi:hypothetical protein
MTAAIFGIRWPNDNTCPNHERFARPFRSITTSDAAIVGSVWECVVAGKVLTWGQTDCGRSYDMELRDSRRSNRGRYPDVLLSGQNTINSNAILAILHVDKTHPYHDECYCAINNPNLWQPRITPWRIGRIRLTTHLLTD